MATILEFRGGGGRVIHRPPPGGNCELILFPGVRYESIAAGEAETQHDPESRGAAKNKASAHRAKPH